MKFSKNLIPWKRKILTRKPKVTCLDYIHVDFYAPKIEDRGAYCFCPVCYSVILSFCPPLWNFILANNFWTVSARALLFQMNIPCDKTFPWILLFLTLWPWPRFDPFIENFNLANNFWIVSARALIFHMNISCDKTFPWVSLFFTLWHEFGVWPIFF